MATLIETENEVIFACAIPTAIQIKSAISLLTDKFLKAFRRFIVRRGGYTIEYFEYGTK